MTSQAFVIRPPDRTLEPHPWGRLEWIVAGRLGNSTELTQAVCVIEPGHQNPPHYHPNCDEVLHVMQGRIRHLAGDEVIEMGPGDTISIPTGMLHNATNVGDDEVILLVTFSTADRQAVGEGME